MTKEPTQSAVGPTQSSAQVSTNTSVGDVTIAGPLNVFLKDLRLKTGLTQTEFAKRMGIPQSQLSAWENDAENITIASLKKYAKVLEAELVINFINERS